MKILQSWRQALLTSPPPQSSRGSRPNLAGDPNGELARRLGFDWLCKHNTLRPEPTRFVRLDSEHVQSDVTSVNRGLPVLDQSGTRPEVAILGADQKERGRWGRECILLSLY